MVFETNNDDENLQYKHIQEAVNDEFKQHFRPEFLNRLDEIIVFRQLTKSEVTEIADILLAEVAKQLHEQRQIMLTVSDQFKALVVDEGYDPSYGARPLRRAIMRRLEDSLAESILAGNVNDGDTVIVDVSEQNKVIVQSTLKPEFAFSDR